MFLTKPLDIQQSPAYESALSVVKASCIDWEATPQSVTETLNVEVQKENQGLYHHRANELVGTGYFCVYVPEKEDPPTRQSPTLAFVRCTKPGCFESWFIGEDKSPLAGEDLLLSVVQAGGDLDLPGHYALNEVSVEKLKASPLNPEKDNDDCPANGRY